ncbi:helix-turn-helix domain-containing protein [Evansella sp. AB-P1]|uniref:helix-turn-helix domain-containing protein n=1 Tax=Evansella sp. AB-P1 TaxID=3037653 RepID=UPI00241D2CED|nr:RodZ domain-containing protein [Evansella sp. AB-P1]MDG5789015.1 helix-turn-helix domain-containing protein [Evansella sp. AB-P1]
MSELGSRLKAAREDKGYSLEELQTITKIQKRYLQAIEEGEFSRLPGDFYARAFVKSYADAVGIPSEVLFEEHRDELPQAKKEQVDLPPRVKRSNPKVVKKKSKVASIIPTLIAIIFVLAIAFGIWYFTQNPESNSSGISREDQQSDGEFDIPPDVLDDNENNEENEDNENNNEEEEPEPEPEPEPELEQTFELDRTEGYYSYFTLSNVDALEILMEFTGRSWVAVLNDENETVVTGEYTDGDEIDFDLTGEEQVIFNLGSTSTVDIYINDELFEYPDVSPLDENRQYITIDIEYLDED